MLQQLFGRYAKLRQIMPQLRQIAPNYAAIAVRKYAAITEQIIIGLTWPGKFEKKWLSKLAR